MQGDFFVLKRYVINKADISYIDFEYEHEKSHPYWAIEITLKNSEKIVLREPDECNYVYYEFYGQSAI